MKSSTNATTQSCFCSIIGERIRTKDFNILCTGHFILDINGMNTLHQELDISFPNFLVKEIDI